MPIVLATAEGAESSGYTYDDKTGIAYEYPNRYKNQIVPGDSFVYHIAKRGYVGMGIVGEVAPSSVPGRWVCSILGYQPFDMPVPLNAVDGYYYEARPAEGKLTVYWSMGVRPISEERFELLVAAAAVNSLVVQQSSAPSGGYASKAIADQVERISVDAALNWLHIQYPDDQIVEMPHNNPGFDVRVGSATAPKMYVEVKGTQAASPGFWITESERQFSLGHAAQYLLIVVSGVDVKGQHTPVVHVSYGAVDGAGFELTPSQWRGSLLAS